MTENERLTIDEIIEHCNRTCENTEMIAIARGQNQEDITSKGYWEHYQVANYLEELQQYRAIGTVEYIKEQLNLAVDVYDNSERLINTTMDMLMEYQKIGTIEEFKALKEKNEPKKPEVDEFDYGEGFVCGECESFLHYVDDDDEHIRTNYCCHCGTRIDWS